MRRQFPVADGGGVVILTDITDLKRTEAALRESEARMSAFFDNSPQMLMLKDLEGRYVLANPAAADVVGTPKEVRRQSQSR